LSNQGWKVLPAGQLSALAPTGPEASHWFELAL
jgi:hypothetical protein